MDFLHQFLFGIYPYIALSVFFAGSLVRFDREQYTWKSDSSQLLRARELRWGSNLFHVGVLFIFVGHLIGLLAPHASYAWLMTAGTKQLLAIVSGVAIAQNKSTVRVPDGLAMSDVSGYESWQMVAISRTDELLNVILANPTMINAYHAGVAGNGKPFPDGSKSVKIQWRPKKNAEAPFSVDVPDTLKNVAFMVKDAKKFSNSGG